MNPDLKTFAAEELGIVLWPKLEEIFDAVQNNERKILIRSCNGAGKTCALAAICNWKLKFFPESVIITTASSHTQVKRNLWGEIRKQAKKAKLYQKGELRESLIKISDKHYAIGISPQLAENAQGFHAPNMLVVVDEATGVSREIITALFGNITGSDAQIILAYNPINSESFPYEAEQNKDWKLITISALEHPNIVGHATLACPGGQAKVAYPTEIAPEIKGAVSREWLEDMLPTWSHEVEQGSHDSLDFGGKSWRKTGEVASRMLGEWSDEGGEGFIPMHLVKRACSVPGSRGTKAMGIDIARSGKDDTVFAFFDGNMQLPFYTMRTKNLVDIAGKIEEYYHEGWKIIALDDTGVGGGVTDILRTNAIPCHGVNFGAAAKRFIRDKHMANTRAEMYFLLDDELKKKEIRLISDSKLHQEITAVRLRPLDGREAYLLESKDDLKKRLSRSPDKADATVLARYGLRLEERKHKLKFM